MRHRIVLGFALAALGGGAASAHEVQARRDYSLIFTSNRDRDYDVYLAPPDGRLRAVTRNEVFDGDVRLSPSGGWLAVRREYDRAVLVSSDGRDRRVLARGTPDGYISFSPAAFSPRGDVVALERYDANVEAADTWLVGIPSGGLRRLGAGAPAGGSETRFNHEGPAFSPDGGRLGFSRRGALGFFDLGTGRARIVVRDADISHWRWSPRWTRLAYVKEGIPGVVVVDVRTGARRTIGRSHGVVRPFTWIGEGAIGFDHELDVAVVARVEGGERAIARGWPYWSPTGRYVATVTWDRSSETSTISVVRSDGREVRTLTVASVGRLWWSPGGMRFAIKSGSNVIVVDVQRGRKPLVVAKNVWDVHEISWSPDGKTLALRGTGRIGLIRAAGGPLHVIKGRGNNAFVGWLRG